MNAAGIETFRRFVAALGRLYEARSDEATHWSGVAAALRELLAASEFRALSRSWPVCGFENLVLFQDKAHGFVVNGLVRAPHHRSPPHDHAHTWTVYGILDGMETITTFERTDDGRDHDVAALRRVETFAAEPGSVQVLPPGLIHTESNGEGRVVAIVVRSEKIGEFLQNSFDPDTGAIERIHGPTQVPYPLL